MSRLKVDRIETTNAGTLKIAPAITIQNSTFTDRVIINGEGNGNLSVTCPIRVGTTMVSATAGQSGQILTSQGADTAPLWKSVAELPLYHEFPIGGIVMWSGAENTIPSGYKLCDGKTYNNGALKTPDLRDRFIIGVSNTYPLDSTGGTKDAVVVAHSHTTEPHSHTVMVTYDTGQKSKSDGSKNWWRGEAGNTNATTVITNSAGESGVGKNLPPYYALYYIMRVS